MPIVELIGCLIMLFSSIVLFYAIENWTDVENIDDNQADEHEDGGV